MTRSEWARRLRWLLLLPALLLLLVLGVATLVSTEAGSAWLLRQLGHHVAGLEVQGVEGRLIDRLQLDSLTFESAQGRGQLQGVSLVWQPEALLQGRLRLQALRVERLALNLAGAVPEARAEASPPLPLSLPVRISLPLQLEVERLAVAQARIQLEDRVQTLERLELSLSTGDDQLRLERLQFEAPEGALALSGQVALGGDYRLDLATSARWHLPNGDLVMKGTLAGPLDALALEQTLSGVVDARLQGGLKGVRTSSAQWWSRLEVQRTRLAALSPALEPVGIQTLTGTAEARGGFDHAQVRGRVHGQHTEADDLEMQFQGELDGPLNDFTFDLNTQLQGIDIPETSLKASGVIGQGEINRLRLQAETLGGQLDVQGAMAWAPYPAWDLQVQAEGFEPGRFWPQWPGRVGGRLQTSGQLAGGLEGLVARVQLQALEGSLRQQPLSGQGALQYGAGAVQLDALELHWGQASLSGNGRVDDQLALEWQLDIPQLADLLADAEGSLSARGRLQGARTLPALVARVEGQELRWKKLALEQLQGRLQFDSRGEDPADINLEARGLEVENNRIDRLTLKIQGDHPALQTQLQLASSQGDLQLSSQGALQAGPGRWHYSGEIRALELVQPLAGRWRLSAPAPVELSLDRQQWSAFCLQGVDQGGQLCTRGEWRLQGPSLATLALDAIPLGLLQPWLPADLTLTGEASGQGRIERSPTGLAYQLSLELPQSELSNGTTPALQLDSTQLRLEGDEQQLEVQLEARSQPLDAELQGWLQVLDPAGSRHVQGQLNLSLADLRPLGTLTPDVAIDQGAARARLDIGGTLAAPRIQGQARLEGAILELPAAGIRLEDLQMTLSDDPQSADALLIQAQARSGEGTLDLQGRLRPTEKRLLLEIAGERFVAMDTEQIRVLISPRVQLDLAPQRVQVSGQLQLPEALIQAPPRSRAVPSTTADLVIQEGQAASTRTAGPEIELNLAIRLGDQVRLTAYGFDGLLSGGVSLRQSGRSLAGTVPRASGRVGVEEGKYSLYGQQLEVTRGSILFSGGPVTNPGLDLQLERSIEDVQVGARVSGTLRQPEFSLTSSPSMPDNSILSWLLLGQAPDESSTGEQQLMMRLALSLASGGGKGLTGQLQERLNLDELGFASGDSLDETEFHIGKYLTPDLYIKYGIGLVEPVSSLLIRLRLSDRWSLETETGSNASGGDLIYSLER